MKNQKIPFTAQELSLIREVSIDIENLLLDSLNKNSDLAILALCNILSKICEESQTPSDLIIEVFEIALDTRQKIKNMDKEKIAELKENLLSNLETLDKKPKA